MTEIINLARTDATHYKNAGVVSNYQACLHVKKNLSWPIYSFIYHCDGLACHLQRRVEPGHFKPATETTPWCKSLKRCKLYMYSRNQTYTCEHCINLVILLMHWSVPLKVETTYFQEVANHWVWLVLAKFIFSVSVQPLKFGPKKLPNISKKPVWSEHLISMALVVCWWPV